jgi:hypothetical protein
MFIKANFFIFDRSKVHFKKIDEVNISFSKEKVLLIEINEKWLNKH